MTHYTKAAGFPNVPIQAGMKIRLRALSPTTDAEVTGVTCSQFAIFGRDLSDVIDDLDALNPPPEWVPAGDEATG